MPSVPITPGSAPGMAMPSETNMLMALADMHKQGRFEQLQPKSSDELDITNRMLDRAQTPSKPGKVFRDSMEQTKDVIQLRDIMQKRGYNPPKSKIDPQDDIPGRRTF